MNRIARHMKADRWLSTRFPASSAAGYLSVKLARSPGRLALDTQARI